MANQFKAELASRIIDEVGNSSSFAQRRLNLLPVIEALRIVADSGDLLPENQEYAHHISVLADELEEYCFG